MATSSSVPVTSSSAPTTQHPLNTLNLPPIATLGKSLIVTGD
ncbi:hypothetical protein A2U01_0092766, partial [Trifolium medium]|nr:hypothetical protein [Trifolium medium]